MSIGFLYWCTKMMLHPRHWRTRWGTSWSIPQCYVLRNLLRILGMVWDSNTHNSKEPKVDDHVIAMQFFTHIIIDDITKTQRCFVSDQIMDCTSLVWVLGIFNIFQWHMGEWLLTLRANHNGHATKKQQNKSIGSALEYDAQFDQLPPKMAICKRALGSMSFCCFVLRNLDFKKPMRPLPRCFLK